MEVSSPILSLLSTDKGTKLMLAPKSHSAFPISEFPMVQGIVKLPCKAPSREGVRYV